MHPIIWQLISHVYTVLGDIWLAMTALASIHFLIDRNRWEYRMEQTLCLVLLWHNDDTDHIIYILSEGIMFQTKLLSPALTGTSTGIQLENIMQY